MKSAPIPDDEHIRLAALYSYRILDTEAEAAFDRCVRTLCRIYDVPIAAVSFVDRDRQWFKSARGLEDCETPRSISFCGHVIAEGGLLVVEDARTDPRFHDNPLVTGPPGIRFYAGAPLVTPAGQPVGVLCIQDREPRTISKEELIPLEDLADLLIAQLELRHRENEQRLRRQLEHRQRELEAIFQAATSVSLIKTDLEGIIEETSTGTEALFGYARHELVGRPVSLVHLPEDRFHPEAIIEHLRHDSTPVRREMELLRSDGTTFPAVFSVHPITDSNNNLIATLSVTFDISDQKWVEQQLEQALRAKSDFLNAISHDLRTPLNALMGFSQLLAETDLTAEERRRYAEYCQRGGERLHGLIDSLLELSQLQSGRLQAHTEPLDLPSLIEGQCALYRPTARAKGIDLICRVDAGLPRWVRGDRTRLEQALSNLIDNAVKYTTAGGVTVTARPEGEQLAFAIEDTGPGIPAATRDQVFAAFDRGDYEGEQPGHGLGLAITREVAQMIGGDLHLHSVEGRGSTFTLTTPLEVLDDRRASRAQRPPTETTERPPPGLRILVAEDEPTNAMLAQTLLERMEARVTVVEDGASALRTWRQHPFDLLLLDLQMPGLDGLRLTRAIRDEEAEGRDAPPVPIALFTAHARSEVEQQGFEAGCDEFLTKPARRSDLEALLVRLAPRDPP
ncbi:MULTISPECIES: hybrid sensor histidine kinase/response regulator [unclassified Halorhodospira]|uniref:hybrid sensor histidine kinase/response regulator n=1 Tax=unclassified Halorhodospira TaxID=2626748 RepID=UPI001EE95967|nr:MULTISPECIES: ATP-binding protein [unclassified Halorhodospira]MCG5541062.1 ATP-binding protein [Halorhodospira sp. M39old]MCG5546141.1 ATP-binding protein [Halorhodospira sp. M38]